VLERSPIRVIVEGRKSGLLHNKFFVADGKRVWTGSTNLTESCLFFNPNNGVWVEEPRVAANFLAKFAEQEQGRFGKKASVRDRLPHPVVEVGGLRIRTLFAPEEDPAATLVEVIDRAEQSVDVMCFVFSSRPITEALLRAHRRGVRVRVLLDNLFASTASTARWKYVPFRELRQAGVACKYDDENSKLHHKVLIADGRTVVLGSYNFSDAGGQENDENVLIVDGEAVASRYQAEFDRLWRYYPDRRVPVPATEGDTDD
jgi:phosphatidylserine/phosphatidylglycerophosphate/cardiolipin synthase-like enzyme